MLVPRSRRERPSNLGPKLREVRESNDQSLRFVERASGLSNGYLSQLERNEVEHPSPTVLRKLADGYGIDFLVLMQWAGYVEDENLALSPNQAAALSTIGDPSDEELDALKGIIEFLRSKKTATSMPEPARAQWLDDSARTQITGYARALLLEAGGLGKRPTPLNELSGAADLVRVGELELTPKDKAALMSRLGRKVELGWKRLRGALDFRTGSIWIKPDLHPMQRRFTLSHEIGHAILPAHRDFFAYVDDWKSLSPDVRTLFEQEANFAAAQLLFQCGQLGEEADSSEVNLANICDYAKLFGASIVATAREVAETSSRDVAVAIAFQPRGTMGPTNLFTSSSFEERYRWRGGLVAEAALRKELVGARSIPTFSEWPWLDVRDRTTTLRVETLHTGYAAIALFAREPTLTHAKRFFTSASRT